MTERTINIETEEDFRKFASGRRQKFVQPVRQRSPIIPSVLGWSILQEREREAMRARYKAEASGAPDDFDHVANLFDALGYTAGSVCRAIAERRRAGEKVKLHVAADGKYSVRG